MAEEIEVKIAISDVREFTRRLKAVGFRSKTKRTFESNILYDFPDGRLRRRGELLRVRLYGSEWKLTFKAPAMSSSPLKRRQEFETGVKDGKLLELVLIRLGMRRSFAYEKYRSEWTDGRGELVIDETPIGVYAELEGPARWIDSTAKRLGFVPSEYLPNTYAELFQQWKRRTRSRAADMTFAAVTPLRPRR